jgi:N6-adenosine-specific RNA methylase IME4
MRKNRVTLELPVYFGAPGWIGKEPEGWEVIAADPAWSFADRGSRIAPDQKKKRQGRKGYRTLSVEQIAAIPVAEVAAKDALLFLWTTSAHLVDGSAARVAQAWGFTPKATIAWVKVKPPAISRRTVRLLAQLVDRGSVSPRAAAEAWAHQVEEELEPRPLIGMGHYVRGAHEHVIVATRGQATRLVADRGVPSVLLAPRGKHSAKPEAFRELVDRLTGRRPVLELFARSSRPGWTAWGDQAPASPDRMCG